MQDKNTTKSTFLQLLDPITNSRVKEKIKALGVDRYVKKLPTTEFLLSALIRATSAVQIATANQQLYTERVFAKRVGH